MKLLILVQACDDDPFKAVNDCQMETWDSVKVDGVETYYYYGANNKSKFKVDKNKIYCPCSEDYNMMHWRMKLTLDYVWTMDWDFIFRTNSSTYVRKERIKNYIETLNPKENIYEGIAVGDMVSGTGILMSRSVAKVLKDKLDKEPSDSEDCCMGVVLISNGVQAKTSPLTRVCYNFYGGEIPDADYYRCKSDRMKAGLVGEHTLDRNYDIEAMRRLQKTLYP